MFTKESCQYCRSQCLEFSLLPDTLLQERAVILHRAFGETVLVILPAVEARPIDAKQQDATTWPGIDDSCDHC
jgi:hypothetical protein